MPELPSPVQYTFEIINKPIEKSSNAIKITTIETTRKINLPLFNLVCSKIKQKNA